MKHKQAHKELYKLLDSEDKITSIEATMVAEDPNELLYNFEGSLSLESGDTIPLDASMQLLRGASLRNTDYIYGLVVYTGHESKIMKNSAKSRIKHSKIETRTQYFIIAIFILEIIFCLIASIYSACWNVLNQSNTNSYLHWDMSPSLVNDNVFVAIVKGMGSWLLIFTDFVPISLLVTLEMVKFF